MYEQTELIATLQNVLSLFNKELVYILDKDRSTICSYMEGKKASDSVILNLRKLVYIANIFEGIHIERIDSFLYRELVDGQTFIDFLKESIGTVFVDKDKLYKFINVIKTTSNKEKEVRLKSKGSGKNLRSLQDVMNEYSTGVMYEI